MAIGGSNGSLLINDYHQNKIVNEIQLQQQRIGVIDWNPKVPTLLATGSKDKSIKIVDLRLNKKTTL